jgi:copper chaperone CopZ
MVQDIGKWIVIRLVIAAVITVAIPDDFFTGTISSPLLNMIVVLLISIPMYLCATGSIPIAAALMLKGLSPGAALVLLMAGPATNMAAILVINKVLGKKTLVIYLLTIIAGAMGFGLVVDYLLPAEWFTGNLHAHGTACCHGGGTPWWQIASSIIFVILLVVAMALRYMKKDACHCGSHCNDGCSTEKRYRIEGMMCNHCKANVEKALSSIEGITAVRVELAEGAAYVTGDIDRMKVVETVKSLGYDCTAD